MTDPEFGEPQFQGSMNTALLRRNHRRLGIPEFFRLPTLRAEAFLGWDSGFYYPALRIRPNSENLGCNYFIQYKVASLYSKKSPQFEKWGQDYFRFQIPFRKEGKKDYHQWEFLKDLSNDGYPCFYCSNTVLDVKDLDGILNGRPVSEVSIFISLKKMTKKHTYVTYIRTPKLFKMHSKTEDGEWQEFDEVEESEIFPVKRSLKSDNKYLLNKLRRLAKTDLLPNDGEADIYSGVEEQNSENPVYVFLFLQSMLFRRHGIFVHRYVS